MSLKVRDWNEVQIVVGVFAAIFNQRREILLEHRADLDMWCLPGGVLEAGESVKQALSRECKEELGVVVNVGNLIGVYSDPARHLFRFKNNTAKHFITLLFHAVIIRGEPASVSEETREIRFFDSATLPTLVPSHSVWIHDSLVENPNRPFIR